MSATNLLPRRSNNNNEGIISKIGIIQMNVFVIQLIRNILIKFIIN